LKSIEILEKKFKKIKDKGWVKSVNEGKGSVGLTLEKLLGKEKDKFELPDYLGLELKTHKRYCNFYTTLFHAAPDGTDLFEIKRLQQKYGYPDRILKYCKVFQGDVTAKEKLKIGLFYSFQLEVDYSAEKVYLCVYHGSRLIDKETFWTFSLLEEKLTRKLSVLAFIEAEEKMVDHHAYFRYTSLRIYYLRSFHAFLSALANGYIIVTFSVGVFRNGNRQGQIHDHGTGFRIYHKNLNKLFYTNNFFSHW